MRSTHSCSYMSLSYRMCCPLPQIRDLIGSDDQLLCRADLNPNCRQSLCSVDLVSAKWSVGSMPVKPVILARQRVYKVMWGTCTLQPGDWRWLTLENFENFKIWKGWDGLVGWLACMNGSLLSHAVLWSGVPKPLSTSAVLHPPLIYQISCM